ncbi:hypothetical protein D3C80_742620 [compost metagenome]
MTSEQVQPLIGLLINLKIVKRYDEQISFRKKVLKQWMQLDLDAVTPLEEVQNTSEMLAQRQRESGSDEGLEHLNTLHHAQKDLFKNFSKIDPVQVVVARKLRELKSDKPKDIYALRDLLEQIFPKSDVRLLLKELIEKGYIYWDGSEVLYSHEMFLN